MLANYHETRQHVTQGPRLSRVKTTINIYIYIYIIQLSCSPLSKTKGINKLTMHKQQTWKLSQTKPQNFLSQFLYSFSCASGLCPSSHFFSFTQSSQSLRLSPSPMLCNLCFLTSLNSLSLATHKPHSLSHHLLTHLVSTTFNLQLIWSLLLTH